MKTSQNQQGLDELVEEVKAKQNNTVWPGPMINSRGVDEFLWKGSPNAPLVQRIAAWIFGVVFIGVGIGWIDVAHRKGYIEFGVLSIFWFFIGVKVFLNGFKRRRKSTQNSQ